MRRKLVAIWRVAVAMLLYPLALAALIWIAWTGRSMWLGIAVIGVVLITDRSWLVLARSIWGLTKKRPRR